jgi:5-methyltetrahydropteroyltriglutamate--homocysteine methyltransferase
MSGITRLRGIASARAFLVEPGPGRIPQLEPTSRTGGEMPASTDRILTTHVGSLPRPERLITLTHEQLVEGGSDEGTLAQELEADVVDVVRRQRDAGVDLINDGEYGHTMGYPYDYGSWWSYVVRRLDGVELVDSELWTAPMSTNPGAAKPGEFVLGTFADRRDWNAFNEAYMDPQSGCALPEQILSHHSPVIRGPIKYAGHDAIQRDIANLKAGLAAAGVEEGWMNAVAPASCARFSNEHYASDEEVLYACADAMREEYKAIIDAGLALQLDDPAIAENWDQTKDEPTVEAYKRFTMPLIEALNHSIRDLPQDKIRFHLCWGSWHGPHSTDLPMADIVEMMLAVNAKYYSFEAANVRHEHEWRVWEDVELPDGKVILPGIVSHATNVIEHPQVVADRIERFAKAVGRENVIASTDCGLGGRVHPQLAWAKLESLSQGAELATKRLWA